MTFDVGSYVVHKKLPELGSGRISKSEMGTMTIQFASGLRNFSEAIVCAHLEETIEAPVLLPVPAKRKSAPRKPRA